MIRLSIVGLGSVIAAFGVNAGRDAPPCAPQSL
jgi:hypothetical protein